MDLLTYRTKWQDNCLPPEPPEPPVDLVKLLFYASLNSSSTAEYNGFGDTSTIYENGPGVFQNEAYFVNTTLYNFGLNWQLNNDFSQTGITHSVYVSPYPNSWGSNMFPSSLLYTKQFITRIWANATHTFSLHTFSNGQNLVNRNLLGENIFLTITILPDGLTKFYANGIMYNEVQYSIMPILTDTIAVGSFGVYGTYPIQNATAQRGYTWNLSLYEALSDGEIFKLYQAGGNPGLN